MERLDSEKRKIYRKEKKVNKNFVRTEHSYVPTPAMLGQHARDAKTEEKIREHAKNKLEIVQIAIASNEKTPIDLLEKLAEHPSWCVRHTLLENPNIPIDILKSLKKDKDKDVARKAKSRYENYRYLERFKNWKKLLPKIRKNWRIRLVAL